MFVRNFLLKVIWFDAPESMIHKSALDSKHLYEGLSKLIDEEKTTIPVKFLAFTFEVFGSSPTFYN